MSKIVLGGQDTQNYTLVISAATGNQNPVITTTAITSVTENTTYIYDVDATDADGDTLTYSLTTSPTGMGINAASGFITWNPGATDVGTTSRNGNSYRRQWRIGNLQSYTITVSAAGTGGTQTPWQDNENGFLFVNNTWDYTMGYRFTPNVGWTSDPTRWLF